MPAIEVDELLEFLNEKKKRHELQDAIASRKVTAAEIREAMAEASDEDKAELRRFLGIVEDQKPEPEKPEEKPEPKKSQRKQPKEKEEETKPRTRPGRKSGFAYDWDVDEETGEQRKLSYAKVYAGESEPDEVEIVAKPAEEDTGDDDDTETD